MTEVLYHTGLLAVDREKDAELDARATILWNLSKEGKIELYQRRVEEGCAYYWRLVKGAL